MNRDTEGEIINGPTTYRHVAASLCQHFEPIVIGWTDGLHSHYDILFTLNPAHTLNLQGGLSRCQSWLYVSIMRKGAFAFKAPAEGEAVEFVHPDYLGEKLSIGSSATATALAELVNGVLRELAEMPAPR